VGFSLDISYLRLAHLSAEYEKNCYFHDLGHGKIKETIQDREVILTMEKVDKTLKPPKVFISYSWTTPEHESWVLELATRLRENYVAVWMRGSHGYRFPGGCLKYGV
jgi:hypothetical protein